MKKTLLIAATLALFSAPAFAQGGAPYNNSGSQAGGPRGGVARELGAPQRVAPQGTISGRHHSRRMMRHHRSMRHYR